MDNTIYHHQKSITFRFVTFIITFLVILLFICPSLLSAHHSTTQFIERINTLLCLDKNTHYDLLIILSPQYRHDPAIIKACHTYTQAIHHDVNWTTTLLHITPSKNHFLIIDDLIEQYHRIHAIHACLLIGEDIHMACQGFYQTMTKPSIIPWATLNGTNSYQILNDQVISTPYKTEIFISLLRPHPDLSYHQKQAQIINTLEKFSTNRIQQKDQITILESSTINTYSHTWYQSLFSQKNITYLENPTHQYLHESITKAHHQLFCIHGHSNPSTTLLNEQNHVMFTVNHLRSLKTSVFVADGCYVNGEWMISSNQSERPSSYHQMICENPSLHLMILGLISQQSTNQPNHPQNPIFWINGTDTITETFLHQKTSGDLVFYGDPTYHFS